MNQIINKNIFWYLCASIPLTFTLGIAITEIFVLISIIFFFYENRDLKYLKDKIFLYLFLFSIYIAINSITQISYDDLKLRAIFHFRFAIFCISIFYIFYFFKDKNDKHNFLLKLIFFLIIFIIFDSHLQFFTGQNILGFEIIKNRISSIFGTELILGSFFLKILPLVLWVLYYSKFDLEKHQKIFYIFFSLYFITIYLSGERTSLILLFISIIIYFVFLKSIRKILIISSIVMSSFMIITSFANIGESDPFNRIFIKTFNQVQNKFFLKKNYEIQSKSDILFEEKKTPENKIFIFSRDHNGHFVLAFHLFKESPIFGKGPGGFKSYCRKVSYDSDVGMCSTHPHNFLMQILAELGLIGFAFYFAGLFYVIIKLLYYHKKNINIHDKSCFIISSIAVLVNLFPFLPSGNFFNNWITIINYYYIGLFIFGYNKIRNQ